MSLVIFSKNGIDNLCLNILCEFRRLRLILHIILKRERSFHVIADYVSLFLYFSSGTLMNILIYILQFINIVRLFTHLPLYISHTLHIETRIYH